MSQGVRWRKWTQRLLGFLGRWGWAAATLAACALPPGKTPTPAPAAAYTAAAQTVVALLTQSAPLPTLTPVASPTPVVPFVAGAPGRTPSPAPTSPTAESTASVPCNRAYLVGDVTIPDGTAMLPGEEFTKTWRLRNTGSCPWTRDYALVFVHGVLMGGSQTVPLDQEVPPGATVDLSVRLIAPREPGRYQGFWRLRDAAGQPFGLGPAGEPFWVSILVVAEQATPTP